MKNLLMAISLLVLCGFTMQSCSSMPKYPEDHLFANDAKNGVCRELEIIDAVNFKYRVVATLPAEACVDVIGYQPEVIPKLREYVKKVNKKLQECKPKLQNTDVYATDNGTSGANSEAN